MQIEIIDDKSYLTERDLTLIKDVISLAAKTIKLPSPNFELDISIVDEAEIQRLNRDFRNKDAVTDVLSFALNEGEDDFGWDEWLNLSSITQEELSTESEKNDFPLHLGDIIICYQRAQEQAQDYGHSFERELSFLAVHGFLHLNGYDHQTPEEEQEMFQIQEEVLKTYGLERFKDADEL